MPGGSTSFGGPTTGATTPWQSPGAFGWLSSLFAPQQSPIGSITPGMASAPAAPAASTPIGSITPASAGLPYPQAAPQSTPQATPAFAGGPNGGLFGMLAGLGI